jgi:hypothetical protein
MAAPTATITAITLFEPTCAALLLLLVLPPPMMEPEVAEPLGAVGVKVDGTPARHADAAASAAVAVGGA